RRRLASCGLAGTVLLSAGGRRRLRQRCEAPEPLLQGFRSTPGSLACSCKTSGRRRPFLASLFHPCARHLRPRKGMLTKFSRSVTPRAAGVLILVVSAAVAAAVTVSTGGGTSAPVHRLSAPAGVKSASSGKSSASSSSISNAPIVTQAIRHDTSIPLRLIKPAASPHTGNKLSPDAGDGESPGVLPGAASDPIVQGSL